MDIIEQENKRIEKQNIKDKWLESLKKEPLVASDMTDIEKEVLNELYDAKIIDVEQYGLCNGIKVIYRGGA